jgi:gamma-glutamylcyclotransferase (GGCT)/AIG2-like uncharacterized protein YtfP
VDHFADAVKLLQNSPERDFDLPFPMGVFGTLRKGCGNDYLMRRGEVSLHRKAFMPHFLARGLSISFNNGSSAPFEIYCYTQDNWNKMIKGVDALEGFSPNRIEYHSYGYFRTLAWLHLLPEDFSHKLYEGKWLGDSRDLKIPQEQWSQYDRVPCWVYSNKRGNEMANKVDTVIWG